MKQPSTMDKITFKINGKKLEVGEEVSSRMSLLHYIRNHLELRGSKYMSDDGSCGASLVSVIKSEGSDTIAVDASMVPVLCCQDWDVTTIEGVGNRLTGYHDLQKALAKQNGNQCGHCSPGFIITMYSLLRNKALKLTKLDIEKAFDSNICRCNGYRPMLDAFKNFAADEHDMLTRLNVITLDKKTDAKNLTEDKDDDWEILGAEDLDVKNFKKITLVDHKTWYRPRNLKGVNEILYEIKDKPFNFIAGDTGKGLYQQKGLYDFFVDINGLEELKGYTEGEDLLLGAGNTITETIKIFDKLSSKDKFSYLKNLKNTLRTVANSAIRNVGTLAGDLMLKFNNKHYVSDVFVVFETIGAKIILADVRNMKMEYTIEEFLSLDMHKKLIISLKLPPLNKEYKLFTYRVMPKAQNAVAIMTAGFLYKLDKDFVVDARIVYNGINNNFNHAKKTEVAVIGKELFNNDTMNGVIRVLKDEITNADAKKSTIQLGLGLLYKGIVSFCPRDKLGSNYLSGVTNLNETRPISTAKSYDSNSDEIPTKYSYTSSQKLIQCAGEALYTDDISHLPHEVFASFVLSSCAKADIGNINPARALAVEGVIAFFSAEDIPAMNSFTPVDLPYYTINEKVFSGSKVEYYSQVVGIIVAETLEIAKYAADLVQITYNNKKAPITDVRLAKQDPKRTHLYLRLKAADQGDDIAKEIKGEHTIHSQCHFESETQSCVSYPSDDGIEVRAATQWIDGIQVAISQALNIQENCINQAVRRIGCSLGAKISSSAQVAVACSLVTMKLNRPCRMILPLEHCMKMMGKRLGANATFEAKLNESGTIQYLKYDIFKDTGYLINQQFTAISLSSVYNCYDKDKWDVNAYDVTTDTAKNTWITSIGTFETISMIENIMEQICYELSVDPIQVRLNNLKDDDDDENPLKGVIEKIKDKADYDDRKEEIESFNAENRWKKRGLGFVPVKWPIPQKGSLPLTDSFNVTLSVHQSDGTIIVTHGGIEMGQGLDDKVIDICSSTLDLEKKYIRVKATNNISNVNSCFTTSLSTEAICFGVKECCKLLEDRLSPIRLLVKETLWYLLIKAAYYRGVNLTVNYNVYLKDKIQHFVYGATIVEVEIDILTGEKEILRVDITQGSGNGNCPEIKISQIQAAFTMGLGYWTMENVLYDKVTGELISDNGWRYLIPQARDIPQDFRIYLNDNADDDNDSDYRGTNAVSEPALCMSIAIAFAIRSAIAASRTDSGIPKTTWFPIEGPYGAENILEAADVRVNEFRLK